MIIKLQYLFLHSTQLILLLNQVPEYSFRPSPLFLYPDIFVEWLPTRFNSHKMSNGRITTTRTNSKWFVIWVKIYTIVFFCRIYSWRYVCGIAVVFSHKFIQIWWTGYYVFSLFHQVSRLVFCFKQLRVPERFFICSINQLINIVNYSFN